MKEEGTRGRNRGKNVERKAGREEGQWRGSEGEGILHSLNNAQDLAQFVGM